MVLDMLATELDKPEPRDEIDEDPLLEEGLKLEDEELEDRLLELPAEPEEEIDGEGEREETEEEADEGMVLVGIELDGDELELLLEKAEVVADPLLGELDRIEVELLKLDDEETVAADTLLLLEGETTGPLLLELIGEELELMLEVDEELVAGPLLPELDGVELELLVLEAVEVIAFC